MQTNTTKAKLHAGEMVLGCFVRYPDASLIEVLGYLGWDFLVFDGEHGTMEPRDCENMVRAAELRGVTPIVRVTTNLAPIILRYLDTGAQGALVPWINSAEEAEPWQSRAGWRACFRLCSSRTVERLHCESEC